MLLKYMFSNYRGRPNVATCVNRTPKHWDFTNILSYESLENGSFIIIYES